MLEIAKSLFGIIKRFLLSWLWIAQGNKDVEIVSSGFYEEVEDVVNTSLVIPKNGVLVKPDRFARTPMEACLHVDCGIPLSCDAYQPYERLARFFPLCYDWSLFEANVRGCSPRARPCGKGKCVDDRCVCPPGTHGNNCETTSTECFKSPCPAGTICITLARGRHRCNMETSPNLQPVFPQLPPSPSLDSRSTVCSGVTCGYRSVCEEFDFKGFFFPICVNTYDPDCTEGSCGPGTCVNGKCMCPTGVHGNRCETNSTMCVSFPCANGGICVTVSGGGYFCQYPIAISTSRTTTRLPANACMDNLCNNDFNAHCGCFPSCMHELGYFCLSPVGYIGRNCDIQPPTIFCEDNLVRVTIQSDFFEEYAKASSSAFMYVSSTLDGPGSYTRQCRANFTNGLYTFALSPFSFACGNSVVSGSGSEVVYTNSIWINIKPNSRYDLPHPVIDFSCSYQKEYSLVTSLQPVVDETRSDISGVLRGTPKISLCKVSTCADDCPPHLVVERGAVYTVAELIHLTVSVTTPDMSSLVSNYQMEIKDAYLSCTSYRTDTGNVLLIDQCEDGTELEARVGRRDDRTSCMSFRVPRLNGCTQFYIHVRMFLCAKQNLETVNCRNGRLYRICRDGIQKRSLDFSNSNLAHQVVGPITIVAAHDGQGKIAYNSNNGRITEISFTNTTGTSRISTTVSQTNLPDAFPMVTIIFCISAVILLSVFIFIALMVFHRLRQTYSSKIHH